MHFSVNRFDASHLLLWLTPNDSRQTPRVRVVIDAERTLELEAWVPFPQLKEFGWHDTGLCGFEITDATCPGLAAASRVAVFDADSNFLLYQHAADRTCRPLRLFTLDYTIDQDNSLRDTIFNEFQMSYFGIREIHYDLLRCVFDGKHTDSLYLHGSLFVRRYEELLAQGEFLKTILIVDPYIELAKRILWLRKMEQIGREPSQSWRIDQLEAPCAFAAGLDFANPSALRKAFDRIDQTTYNWLSNPLTRDLSCTVPGEMLKSGHWSAAMDTLSRFNVIGHQQFWDAYTAMVSDVVGLSGTPPAERAVPEPVLRLAETLSRVRTTLALVELDINLSDKVYTIIEKQWGDKG
ncbi:hypothetical protein OPKNFCMD_6065 [Methylobacterium crusticola]|uniref:DUF4435 domain-containing protein n=1 Tax=Methylobacterium crusticola TaxID=1697972 RepID=A0ABQ4R8R8_9HYPH|nr:hypothetical protein [Methylobacterium crusticola]GJD53290.1 hypothetical protein OPKNFCMD_6065 [Methylobacterium crusticola]